MCNELREDLESKLFFLFFLLFFPGFAASKRSHESPVLGGGGGGGEQITQQASISPSSLSPASATQLTPPSSNGSLRKKMVGPILTSDSTSFLVLFRRFH